MTPTAPPNYPSDWEYEALLADGGAARVRPIRPDDAAAHRAFFGLQSRESVHSRFFSTKVAISAAEVTHFTTVDYQDRMAFVAFLGDEMIAVGRYERIAGAVEAEVAFAVADAHQRRGLATLMLKQLAAYAAGHGIRRFTADTLVDNRHMLAVFRAAGFRAERTIDYGVVHLACDIGPFDAVPASPHQE
jgi:RimJ/RimL family protein N-acetyltransferase